MCVWGLWSNFIKVCFSSVLSLLGIMYYFPAGNCNNVFEVRFQYEMRNLLQKCTKWYLSSCWNLGKIPFMSCSWCVSPGQLWSSCSSRRTAFLAAVTYWAVQWENYLIVGTYPDGFESLEQFISCRNQYLWFQLLSRRWRFGLSKQQEESERKVRIGWVQ